MRIARDIITCKAKPLARSLTHSLRMRWVGWTVRWFPVPSYWTLLSLGLPPQQSTRWMPCQHRGRQRRR